LEYLPFNEFCLYSNNYIEELQARKKRADEQEKENKRLENKYRNNKSMKSWK